MEEVWVPIKGYEKFYSISDQGHVFSKCSNRLIGPNKHGNRGYSQVSLQPTPSSPQDVRQIARLVAEHFIPNPDGLPCVLHRDFDVHNNAVDNLYWGTYKDAANQEETIRVRRERAAEKNGYVMARKGDQVFKCLGIRGATEKTGVPKSTVQYALAHSGNTKSGWFFWRDKEENENDWTRD